MRYNSPRQPFSEHLRQAVLSMLVPRVVTVRTGVVFRGHFTSLIETGPTSAWSPSLEGYVVPNVESKVLQ